MIRKISHLIGVLFLFHTTKAQALTEYVACTDQRADEYNVLLIIEDSRAKVFSVLEDDLKRSIEIPSDAQEIDIRYASEYDTNYSYNFKLTPLMTREVHIQVWVSGNDSDNYYGTKINSPTICHQLKARPRSAVITTQNYLKSIPVSFF